MDFVDFMEYLFFKSLILSLQPLGTRKKLTIWKHSRYRLILRCWKRSACLQRITGHGRRCGDGKWIPLHLLFPTIPTPRWDELAFCCHLCPSFHYQIQAFRGKTATTRSQVMIYICSIISFPGGECILRCPWRSEILIRTCLVRGFWPSWFSSGIADSYILGDETLYNLTKKWGKKNIAD